MSWFAPIVFIPKPPGPPKLVGRRPPRPINIRGKQYPSVSACVKATGFSIYRVYKLLGEKHRFHKKK